MADALVHLLARDGQQAECRAQLVDPLLPEAQWNWTEQRDETTCEDCADRHDEAGWERQEEARACR